MLNFRLRRGFANDAYGSVVERLRSIGADIRKRRLAVVVQRRMRLQRLCPTILYPMLVLKFQWHRRRSHLITRIEMDFEQVDYFAVASLGGSCLAPSAPLT